MALRHTLLHAAAAILAGALALPAPSQAQDSIYVPLFTYRTGAFAGSGVPIADGMHDYLEMLNQRGGGIGGVKLVIEECEMGYDTKKGIECYEAVKSKNPVVVNPWSTGVTLPILLGQSLPAILGPFGIHIGGETIEHLRLIVLGVLIIVFLIVEPHGLARLWQIGKQKLRVWPFPY